MAIVRDRHDPVRIFLRRIGMLALVFASIAAGSAVWDVYHKDADARILRVQAEQQLHDLQLQQTQLSANIAQLKTDRGREEALRESYDVGQQGENLIIIVDPPAPEPIPQESKFNKWMHTFLPFF